MGSGFNDWNYWHFFTITTNYNSSQKLHNEELHNLYSSASTIRMIKSRRMRWPGAVTRMGKKRNA
jgi:hypothetical protein